MSQSRNTPYRVNARRQFLHAGVLLPLGISLTDLQRAHSHEANPLKPTAKSCILLWLDGGPSHLETFDPKPDAPSEVRGPFRPTRTNVVDIQLSEHLARTASVCDKLAIIRSMTSPLGEHGLANQYLLTGYKPSPAISYPSFGSMLSNQRSVAGILPPYIGIPGEKSGGSGFLGTEYEPFTTGGDAASPDFSVRDLEAFAGVDNARLRRRHEYLTLMNQMHRHEEPSDQPNDEASDSALERAFRLVRSPEAKNAFQLSEESTATRNRYGLRTFGQGCLLARRLVERGVPFVTVEQPGWDTHNDLVLSLRDGYSGAKQGVGLIPTFDQAFSALIEDLSSCNLLDETLVIAMGEFGRTPKINPGGGRDHWPRVFSVVLAGGGVRGGQVIGSSDRTGESPRDQPVTPADLAHSLYSILGVDPHSFVETPERRPIQVNQGGHMIRGLL